MALEKKYHLKVNLCEMVCINPCLWNQVANAYKHTKQPIKNEI